jgi:hypothetical protein
MDKRFSILVGVLLVLMGSMALTLTLGLPILGWDTWQWGAWRLWPLIVVCLGLLFMLTPLLARGHRGLGSLFIPGTLVLITGAILLLASVLDFWGVWAWLWPLEILALATGFFAAALYMRTIWLTIPAIIIGVNGLVLQFCAITSLWHLWSVLWTIEPLSVGLSLMVVSLKARSTAVFLVGILLCSLAGIGLIGMTAITFFSWWLFSWIGPAILILSGLALLVWGILPRSPSATPTTA